MIAEASLSIGICLAALVLTMLVVRRSRATLALPLAYIINLLLIHVPGAYALVVSGGEYAGFRGFGDAIATGIFLTAIAAMCFVAGAAVVMLRPEIPQRQHGERSDLVYSRFVIFCLVSGAVLTFGVGSLRSVPTLGAALYFGSAIWMLTALVGLAAAVRSRDFGTFLVWLAVVFVYPIVLLLLSGFLGYGAVAVIIIGSLAVMQMRSIVRSLLVIVFVGFLGISVFVNYFDGRTQLRATLWSGAGFEQRIDAVVVAFSDFSLFSASNPAHLRALTKRLNQNEFVGISAERLSNGQSTWLRGESFWQAAIAPIPRAIWADKPVEGGSGQIVTQMTGLKLARNTSWGVGNVMEFYINFGLWSLVPGFLLLGYVIAWLDRRAALWLASPQPSRALFYFMPCVALIQPNGSLVELVGGAFAALLAAAGLHLAWIAAIRPRPARDGRAPGPAGRASQ